MARGNSDQAAQALYWLIFEPRRKKVYPSFPMTHVMDLPGALAEINTFRSVLAEHFTTFDPGDLNEKRLHLMAVHAAEQGRRTISLSVKGRHLSFEVS